MGLMELVFLASLAVAQQRPLEQILPELDKAQQAARELIEELKKLVPVPPTPTDPTVIDVPAGADLNAAIIAAPAGARLRLPKGGEFVGNFAARRDALTIEVADAEASLGTRRVTVADLPSMAVLRSTTAATVLQANGKGLRFRGVAFQAADNTNDIVTCEGDDVQFNQVLILGTQTTGGKRGLAAQCGGGIKNSSFKEIWRKGQDSSGIGTWNSARPFYVDNNYIEAGSEPILLGGADASVPGVLPTDWVITNNHLTRPAAWVGLGRSVKNLFEIKAGRRITLRGNLLENNWRDGQPGWAIVLTPATDGVGCGAAEVTIEDVTIEDNIIRNTQGGFNVLGTSQECGPLGRTSRVVIRRNLVAINKCYNQTNTTLCGQGWFMQLAGGPRDFTIDRNTILQNGNQFFTGSGEAVTGWSFTGNVVSTAGLYGMFLSVAGSNRPYGGRWAEFFLGGVFTGNAIASAPSLLRTNLPNNFYAVTGAEAAVLIDAEGYTSGVLAPYGRPR